MVGTFRSETPGGSPYGRPIDDEPPPILVAVRHIGPRRARRLILALGAEWRALVRLTPARVFGTLRGVGPRQAREAADSWCRVDAAFRRAAGRRGARPSAAGQKPLHEARRGPRVRLCPPAPYRPGGNRDRC
jgi:hypothetical protein